MNISNQFSAFWDCLKHERNVQRCPRFRHLACFECNSEALKYSLCTISSSWFGTEPLSVSAFSSVTLFLRQWFDGKVFNIFSSAFASLMCPVLQPMAVVSSQTSFLQMLCFLCLSLYWTPLVFQMDAGGPCSVRGEQTVWLWMCLFWKSNISLSDYINTLSLEPILSIN